MLRLCSGQVGFYAPFKPLNVEQTAHSAHLYILHILRPHMKQSEKKEKNTLLMISLHKPVVVCGSKLDQ